MAKLGRYSADRKKVEALSASKDVTVADCGTVFMVTPDASSTVTLTLPTCVAAGEGWWCKVVLANAATSRTVAVNVNSQTTIGVELSATCAAITGNFDIDSTAGAQAEIVCDGTRYIVLAHGSGAGDIA